MFEGLASAKPSVVPPLPPTDSLHNWLRLVRNAGVEGMLPAHDAAELVQTSAYMALVYFEECSRVEQELHDYQQSIDLLIGLGERSIAKLVVGRLIVEAKKLEDCLESL